MKTEILLGCCLLSGLIGCFTPVTINKTQEIRFAGVPKVTRVDNGAANKEGEIRIASHFSYKIDEPQKRIYKKTIIDTGFLQQVNITTHRSVLYEPRGSVGAEFTYSFNDLVGLGSQFGFASVNFTNLPDSSLPNELSMFRTGIHGRFTKQQNWVSVGYRPALFIGSFHGNQKLFDSVMVPYECEWVRKCFISFEQSVFLRVSLIDIAGVFAGFKHDLKPVGIIDNRRIHKNSFQFYGGLSAELLDLLSLSFYGSIPINPENQLRDIPTSIGALIGIVFCRKGEDDD